MNLGIGANNEFGTAPLMRAVAQNDVKAIRIFLDNGSPVDKQNMAGVSALHIAARYNSIEAAKLLLENSAAIDIADFEGFTPLMRACLGRNAEMVELLVKNGALAWKSNIFGENAIMHCCLSDCVKCLGYIRDNLVNNGSDKQDVDRDYFRALEIIKKKENNEMKEVVDDVYNIYTGKANNKKNRKREKVVEKSKDAKKGDGKKKSEPKVKDAAKSKNGEGGVRYIFKGKKMSVQEIEKDLAKTLRKKNRK
jgi:ankyrin repeat protein